MRNDSHESLTKELITAIKEETTLSTKQKKERKTRRYPRKRRKEKKNGRLTFGLWWWWSLGAHRVSSLWKLQQSDWLPVCLSLGFHIKHFRRRPVALLRVIHNFWYSPGCTLHIYQTRRLLFFCLLFDETPSAVFLRSLINVQSQTRARLRSNDTLRDEWHITLIKHTVRFFFCVCLFSAKSLPLILFCTANRAVVTFFFLSLDLNGMLTSK